VCDVVPYLRSLWVFNRDLTITEAPDLGPKRLVLDQPSPPHRYSVLSWGHAASCFFGYVALVLRRCGKVRLALATLTDV
jgi:hypothetical protein